MKNQTIELHWLIWGVPIIMLLFAVLPLPYGYYQFLRLVVCGFSGFLAWTEFSKASRINPSAIVFFLIALLMNPIFTVEFTKAIWIVLNLITAAFFTWHKVASTPARP